MTIHGLQHIGFTVPDMDEAERFFTEHFGAVTCFSTGRVESDDDVMIRRLGVPGPCRMEDIRVLRIGQGTNLEIFQYSGDPAPDEPLKRNSQPGGFHLAFEVDDCEATAARLRAGGVEVLDGPNRVESGPMEGLTWCYLKAPWGLFLEIVSLSEPLAYERESGPKQWSPVTGR
jgi:catechol 2,3-dioxygenase-like lactoylglutathione lyase family enzyme